MSGGKPGEEASMNMPFRPIRLIRSTERSIRLSLPIGTLPRLLVFFASAAFSAQTASSHWNAIWISHPTAPLREPAVFHFRKTINRSSVPDHLFVDVSADNRFILYVNGNRVAEGPARGDLRHWRYERIDLAPALHSGTNVIAAVVWNLGIYAPLAQISERSAFLLQAEDEHNNDLNSGSSWEVEREQGFTFVPREANNFWFYWAADPGEQLHGTAFDWTWKTAATSPASEWKPAAGAIRESIYPSASRPSVSGDDFESNWALVADTLPAMEYRLIDSGHAVRTNLDSAEGFPQKSVVIPPHSSIEILLDKGEIVSGYPLLTVSGGRDAIITLGYTEALYDAQNNRANRNEVKDRRVLGLSDTFLPDGGEHRAFEPLWFRTWRYLQILVKTGDESVTLESLATHFSAYPFQERASFHSPDPDLDRIWQMCWRTARVGAHETYMDTPFWEQLQYIDDAQLQMLISYVVAGDGRLARQALQAFDQSRVPEGLTQSRYPSHMPQFIPNFSLSYIAALREYWTYEGDEDFVRTLVPGTRPVLEWYSKYLRPDGMLARLPYWNAIDFPVKPEDFPRFDPEGRSALVTLLYVGALRDAASLEEHFGDPALARRYRQTAARSAQAVFKLCWNAKAGLLADTPERNSFSQHSNLMGILTDAIPGEKQHSVMQTVLDASLSPERTASLDMALVSYHYQFFLSRALEKTGFGNKFIETLKPWREMLDRGLTTTPEYADPTRSDTHAWSAHPIYDLLTIVAGIRPSAPGFSKVRIAPNPGTLPSFNASMPWRDGTISVSYARKESEVHFRIDLPVRLHGTFFWDRKRLALHPGVQDFSLPRAN
jgi:hypothetical protein